MNGTSRLAGAVLAALAASALFASAAGASAPIKENQMSLGDSLAFGYSQELFNINLPAGDPANAFEHGYVNDYFNHLRPKTNGVGLQNLGCPGETTDSMIGNGPLGAVLDPAEGESPCAYHKSGLPLHDEYGGKSQLETAIEQLTIDALSGKPVTHVTFNIGANDELRSIHACEAEVKTEFETGGKSKYGATPEESVHNCIVSHVSGLIHHLLVNIGAITYAIRNYGTFAAAATGKPELSGLKYVGPIIWVESYDPYGNVFGTGELLSGSVGLAGLINGYETKLMTDEGAEAASEGHEPFHACVADMLPKFNTGKPKTESAHLQAWTNMANTTESNGHKNGPDIHPTPLGYKVMNSVMIASCG